jgi:hypothetical protein
MIRAGLSRLRSRRRHSRIATAAAHTITDRIGTRVSREVFEVRLIPRAATCERGTICVECATRDVGALRRSDTVTPTATRICFDDDVRGVARPSELVRTTSTGRTPVSGAVERTGMPVGGSTSARSEVLCGIVAVTAASAGELEDADGRASVTLAAGVSLGADSTGGDDAMGAAATSVAGDTDSAGTPTVVASTGGDSTGGNSGVPGGSAAAVAAGSSMIGCATASLPTAGAALEASAAGLGADSPATRAGSSVSGSRYPWGSLVTRTPK